MIYRFLISELWRAVGGPREDEVIMSDQNLVRARILSDGSVVQVSEDGSTRPLVGETDWARFDAMTEEEIEANALADPDNPPATDEQLARLRRAPNPKAIRERLAMSLEEFAVRFQIPVILLHDWEQGRAIPNATARTLLRVIDANPEAVIQALAS
jgi:putative transcriptional regulator